MAKQLEFWEDAPAADPPAPEPIAAGEPSWNEETAEALRRILSTRSGMHVFLRVTRHAGTLLRVAHEPGGTVARLNLHWIFLDAPDNIVTALAKWVRSPRKVRRDGLLRAYMNANQHRIPPSPRRQTRIKTRGLHYDLRELYDEVNASDFGGAVEVPITWGVWSAGGGGRGTHFRFGSYCPVKNLIRINPVLDSEMVPRFVIRSIVFHEMLHAALGIEKGETGRRRIHHAAFRAREQQHPDYQRSEDWINNPKNMRMLKRRRKTPGTPPDEFL